MGSYASTSIIPQRFFPKDKSKLIGKVEFEVVSKAHFWDLGHRIVMVNSAISLHYHDGFAFNWIFVV